MEQIKRMRGGSQSHFMRCSDGVNHDLYYVVKFQNNPQGRRILVNELLGTRIASLMGLPTTATAVVHVGQDLINYTPVLSMELPRHRIPCRAGLQFGSSHPGDPRLRTLFDFVPDQQLREVVNLHDFAGMLVFDKWMCNTDGRQVIFYREDESANRSYKAVMVDQGFCFNADNWNFPDAPLRGRYCRVAAYDWVTGLDCFEPWLTLLESKIDASSLLAAARGIPVEWYEEDIAGLNRLLDRLDKRRKIVRELLISMASATPRQFPNWTMSSGLSGNGGAA
jgi:hypothetical protein